MGSPRKPKKQYSRPFKIWNRDRLDREKPIVKEFGLKNKTELWRSASLLRKYTSQAKRLIASRGEQAAVEKKQLVDKLSSLGIIDSSASLDDVLGLTINDFLSRRLQTIVFKRNLSRTIDQSRQFITHRHIKVGNKTITAPSYLVPLSAEQGVSFVETTSLAKADHPERAVKEVKEVPDPENAEE